MMRRRLAAIRTRKKLQIMVGDAQLAVGDVERTESSRAEEDDGIANALAAETREGLGVLRHDADEAAVRTVQEAGVLVGERSGFERRRQSIRHRGKSVALFAMKEDAERDPDVEQAETGDDTADPALRHEACDSGPIIDPGIGGPDATPWQQDDQGTDVEAKNDEESDLDDHEPARYLPVRLRRWLRRDRCRRLVRSAEEISLIRHPLPGNFKERPEWPLPKRQLTR